MESITLLDINLYSFYIIRRKSSITWCLFIIWIIYLHNRKDSAIISSLMPPIFILRVHSLKSNIHFTIDSFDISVVSWKKVKVKSLNCVQLFVTPQTVAYQAPPSMGFYRQEYWSFSFSIIPSKEIPGLILFINILMESFGK